MFQITRCSLCCLLFVLIFSIPIKCWSQSNLKVKKEYVQTVSVTNAEPASISLEPGGQRVAVELFGTQLGKKELYFRVYKGKYFSGALTANKVVARFLRESMEDQRTFVIKALDDANPGEYTIVMSGADEPIIIPVKTMVRMPGLENMQSASKAKIQTFSITGVEPNELYLEPGGPRKDVAVSGTQLNTNDFTISVYNVVSKESVNTIKTKLTPTEIPESRQVVIWAESQTPAGEYMMTFNAAGKTSRLPLKIRVVMKGIPKTKANSKIILNKKPIQ